MRNPFSGLFRARDKPQDSVSAAPVFYFGTSGSGKAVTVQTAIQLSMVYACVRVISETVASLPLGIYETVNDGNEKVMDQKVVGSNPAGLTREIPYRSTSVGDFLVSAKTPKSAKKCQNEQRLVVKTVVKILSLRTKKNKTEYNSYNKESAEVFQGDPGSNQLLRNIRTGRTSVPAQMKNPLRS